MEKRKNKPQKNNLIVYIFDKKTKLIHTKYIGADYDTYRNLKSKFASDNVAVVYKRFN